MTHDEHLIWHDLECGGYDADQALWRMLAEEAGGPVLDVGAGSGRVTLELAAAGIPVTALDADAHLLGVLAERAAELPVDTVAADARSFDLGRRFPLILVPMQTIQLLGGAHARARFLGCARAHLEPGGLVAIAIADGLDDVVLDAAAGAPLLPDVREDGGTVYSTRPITVRPVDGGVEITWLREVVPPDGEYREQRNTLVLDRLDVPTLEAEGRAAGLTPEPAEAVPPTDEYIGSDVVMLRG